MGLFLYTDQYLLFSSHHPVEHKLGVVRTLNHRANIIVSRDNDRKEEQSHVNQALQRCGYPRWAVRSSIRPKKSKERKDRRTIRENLGYKPKVVLPYIGGVSEKIRRVLEDYNITTYFKPHVTLRRRLVHPKDRIPKDKKPDIVYGIRCSDATCEQFYIGETSQPLKSRMSQHRRPSSSGYDSAVYTHLEDSGHRFNNKDVVILDKESRWFERGVKEAIYERSQKPSLNKHGGLRFHLSHTWDKAVEAIPKVLSVHQWQAAAVSVSSEEAVGIDRETVSNQ